MDSYKLYKENNNTNKAKNAYVVFEERKMKNKYNNK